MKSLGLEINLSKSIISPEGKGLEFAKKTILGGEDVSPIPLKEYSAALSDSASLVSFIWKYDIRSKSTLKSILGLGYKSNDSKRWLLLNLARNVPQSYGTFEEIIRSLNRLPDKDFEAQREILLRVLSEMISALNTDLSNAILTLQKNLISWYSGASMPALPDGQPPKGQPLSSLRAWLSEISNPFSYTPGVDLHLDLNVDITVIDRYTRAEMGSNAMDMLNQLSEKSKGIFDELSEFLTYGGFSSIHNNPLFRRDSEDKILRIAKAYYEFDEEFALLQVQQLISPKPEETQRPMDREAQRLAQLWTRWSNSILKRDDGFSHENVLQSALFPISWILKRIFLSTGKGLIKGLWNRFWKKPLATAGFGIKSLFLYLGVESVMTFSFVAILFYGLILCVFLFNWITDGPTERFIPFLTAPLELPKDLIHMYFTAPNAGLGVLRYFTSAILLMDIHYVGSRVADIQAVWKFVITDNHYIDGWFWNTILMGVTGISIFIKFAIYPVIAPLLFPVAYLLRMIPSLSSWISLPSLAMYTDI
jgi:hypothetical protein